MVSVPNRKKKVIDPYARRKPKKWETWKVGLNWKCVRYFTEEYFCVTALRDDISRHLGTKNNGGKYTAGCTHWRAKWPGDNKWWDSWALGIQPNKDTSRDIVGSPLESLCTLYALYREMQYKNACLSDLRVGDPLNYEKLVAMLLLLGTFPWFQALIEKHWPEWKGVNWIDEYNDKCKRMIEFIR